MLFRRLISNFIGKPTKIIKKLEHITQYLPAPFSLELVSCLVQLEFHGAVAGVLRFPASNG